MSAENLVRALLKEFPVLRRLAAALVTDGPLPPQFEPAGGRRKRKTDPVGEPVPSSDEPEPAEDFSKADQCHCSDAACRSSRWSQGCTCKCARCRSASAAEVEIAQRPPVSWPGGGSAADRAADVVLLLRHKYGKVTPEKLAEQVSHYRSRAEAMPVDGPEARQAHELAELLQLQIELCGEETEPPARSAHDLPPGRCVIIPHASPLPSPLALALHSAALAVLQHPRHRDECADIRDRMDVITLRNETAIGPTFATVVRWYAPGETPMDELFDLAGPPPEPAAPVDLDGLPRMDAGVSYQPPARK